MKGYKVFKPDWTCRGFKYEVGKTYKHDGPLSICNSGFRFCRNAADCFNYYSFDPNNKVAEIEALGLVESDDTKSVTDEIKIVREIPWQELLEIVNIGKACTGLGNTGNWNTGFFSTITPKMTIFEKPTDLTYQEIINLKGMQALKARIEKVRANR